MEWTTFSATSVQIGDRVQTQIGANPVEVTTMQPLAGGGRRLHLADGTHYDLKAGRYVRGFALPRTTS